jgi:hypothetical protein
MASRARKERDPNWSRQEILALVRAKRVEFVEELEVDDPRELMSSEMTKWDRIALSVNAAPGIVCYRSAEACKYKWQVLLPDYKRVADLHKGTGTNSLLYFELTSAERREKTLPKNFDSHVYAEMHDWLKHKPTMAPPHFRDLLNPSDGNFRPPPSRAEEVVGGGDKRSIPDRTAADATLNQYSSAAAYDSVDSVDDVDDVPADTEHSVPRTVHVPDVMFRFAVPPHVHPPHAPGPAVAGSNVAGTSQSPLPQRPHSAPVNVTPGVASHVPATSATSVPVNAGSQRSDPVPLSSSETSAGRTRKPTSGSTGVRRKTNTAIKLVADATLEGSERLLAGLKAINESAKDMKRQEMDMELHIHDDNLRYKLEKDERMMENARLALLNQGAVVAAISNLADAIRGTGLPAAATAAASTDENEQGKTPST